MRISETACSRPAAEYRAALEQFARSRVVGAGRDGAAEAFRAVRDMPYFSCRDRTPLAALRAGRGACTAKHLLLRDLLRGLGFQADVELVECDFAAAVPAAPTMPEPLRAATAAGGVRDVHCWVRLRDGERGVLLDATWPEALAKHGFPVNGDWDGAGDTRPAVPDGVVRGAAEDVLARKAELLAELTEDESRVRREFLARLSAWMDDLEPKRKGGTR